MNEAEKEEAAFKLIDMTGWALKQLYGGTIPVKWKERIKLACDMKQAGGSVEPAKRERDIEIATKFLAHKIAIPEFKKDKKSYVKSTQFIEDLAAEYKFQDIKTVQEIAEKYKNEAALKLRQALKILAKASIAASLECGEVVKESDIELFQSITIPTPEIDRITKWIQNGEALSLVDAETDFQEKFIKTFLPSKKGGQTQE